MLLFSTIFVYLKKIISYNFIIEMKMLDESLKPFKNKDGDDRYSFPREEIVFEAYNYIQDFGILLRFFNDFCVLLEILTALFY